MQVSSGQWEVKESRVDTDRDHAERVLTRKSAIAVESWMQSKRLFSVPQLAFCEEVEGVLILIGANSMVMIDLAR